MHILCFSYLYNWFSEKNYATLSIKFIRYITYQIPIKYNPNISKNCIKHCSMMDMNIIIILPEWSFAIRDNNIIVIILLVMACIKKNPQ